LIYRLFFEQSIFSQEAFGPDTVRGPIGVLKHLKKEVDEVLEHPLDITEYADCLLLLLDASRRAGFTLDKLIQSAYDKLQVNKKRVWPNWRENSLTEPLEDDRKNE
jgi:hypothetical protein